MSAPNAPSPSPKFLGSALFYLIVINLMVYLFQAAGFLHENRLFDGAFEKMQFGSLAQEDLGERFEFWRLGTYMFVHDIENPLHVGLNMLMILCCGMMVQRVLGGRAVVLIYLLGGLVGALAHVAMFEEPVVGASASAFALLVALGMLIPERKVFVLLGLVLPVRMRVKFLVIGIITVTFAFFAIDLIAGPDTYIPMITGIGHLAHLGGGLAGYLYCKLTGVGRALTLADLQAQRAAGSTGSDRPPRPMGGYNGGTITRGDEEFEGFSMTDVDPILDKIARDGFLSLTEEERSILQRGQRLMTRT